MPYSLAIRLTMDYPPKLVEWIVSKCDGLFMVQHHVTTNSHYHLAIKNAHINHDNFRKQMLKKLKELYPGKKFGNKFLSVKAWDDARKYPVYMIKGKSLEIHPIPYNNLFTPEEIEQIRSEWVEDKNEIQQHYESWQGSPLWVATEAFDHKRNLEDPNYMGPKKPPFTRIVKAARDYIISTKGEWEWTNHKHMIKHLVSQYCYRNNLAPGPIYL